MTDRSLPKYTSNIRRNLSDALFSESIPTGDGGSIELDVIKCKDRYAVKLTLHAVIGSQSVVLTAEGLTALVTIAADAEHATR